jgi:hypothetical protein
MPTGGGSLAALLADALKEPATFPGSAASSARRSSQSSFYEVKCHEGFKCISKVESLGRNHDLAYKGQSLEPPKSIDKDAYEEGCPAKGKYTESGGCTDTERGRGTSLCWDMNRYESGKDTPCEAEDSCMCVKNVDNGVAGAQDRFINRSAGDEKYGQTLITQAPHNCDSCEAYNADYDGCKHCARCEFTERELNGRVMKGCFVRDPGKPLSEAEADDEPSRVYLAGSRGVDKEIRSVLPHYPLWNPSDTMAGSVEPNGTKWQWPWNSNRTKYSREMWLEKYKKAAPHIQFEMDKAARKLKKFQADPETGNCQNQLDCLSGLPVRIRKYASIQKGCQTMQELEFQLRQGNPTEFEPKVTTAKHGPKPVNCKMGQDAICHRLNCYTSDLHTVSGMKCLKKRLTDCKSQIRAYDMKNEAKEAGLMSMNDDLDKEDAALEADGSPDAGVPQRAFPPGGNKKKGGPGGADTKEMQELEERDPTLAAAEKQEMAAKVLATEDANVTGDPNAGVVPGEHLTAEQEKAAEHDMAQREEEYGLTSNAAPAGDPNAGITPGEHLSDEQEKAAELDMERREVEFGLKSPTSNTPPPPAAQSLEGVIRAGLATWAAAGAAASAVPRPSQRKHHQYRNFL